MANITLLLMIRSSGDRDLDLDDDSAQSPFCEMKRAAESERASEQGGLSKRARIAVTRNKTFVNPI